MYARDARRLRLHGRAARRDLDVEIKSGTDHPLHAAVDRHPQRGDEPPDPSSRPAGRVSAAERDRDPRHVRPSADEMKSWQAKSA